MTSARVRVLRRVTPAAAAPLGALALLLAGLLLSYSRLVFEGLVMAGYDTQTYFYPYWAAAFDALGAGRTPLWNPALFTGAPFLANPQTAVFYPPNWLLLGLSAERALGAALILHAAWAAAGTLALARVALRLGWPAATAGAAVFAFGGYFVAQAGHVNQVSATAWLPWLLLALDRAVAGDRRGWLTAPIAAGLLLLAGHPQVAYMSLGFGLVYAQAAAWAGGERQVRRRLRAAARAAGAWTAAAVGGALLAAVQLLPTLELSHFGIRSGGLSLADAASFSLPPDEILQAVLPTFTALPSSTEFVAHVGTSGLILAVLGIVRGPRGVHAALLAATIVAVWMLALGPASPLFGFAHRIVPGFDLFRVPPRWLLLGLLAAALLAARGVEGLGRGGAALRPTRRALVPAAALAVLGLILTAAALVYPVPSKAALPWVLAGVLALAALTAANAARWGWVRWLAAVVVVAELVAASGPGAARAAVPPQVYARANPVQTALAADAWAGRILSLARPSFEIDQTTRARLADTWFERLGERSYREMLVALKHAEILSPNLSLAHGIASADGYDGGVLPLRSYVQLRDALLPGTGATPDVLIRDAIDAAPPDRVLDAFAVRALVRERGQTFQDGAAIVDLEFVRTVDDLETWDGLAVPDVTGVAVVIDAPTDAPAGPAGTVELRSPQGGAAALPLTRSRQRPERVALGPGRLLPVRGGLDRPAFMSRAALAAPMHVAQVRVAAAGLPFQLRALSLLHADGTATALALRPGAAAVSRPVGQMVVTRRAQVPPRAWLVRNVRLASSAAEAKALVASPAFDPSTTAVLVAGAAGGSRWGGVGDWARALGVLSSQTSFGRVRPAQIEAVRAAGAAAAAAPQDRAVESIHEAPERVVLRVRTNGPRLLVLPDAPYPGWQARVDGQERPVWSANLGHRAVLIADPGEHVVEFVYRSIPFEAGRVVSLVSLAALAAAAALPIRARRS